MRDPPRAPTSSFAPYGYALPASLSASPQAAAAACAYEAEYASAMRAWSLANPEAAGLAEAADALEAMRGASSVSGTPASTPPNGGSPEARGVGSPEAWDAQTDYPYAPNVSASPPFERVSVSHAYARDALDGSARDGSSRPALGPTRPLFFNATLPALCRWRQRSAKRSARQPVRRGRHVPSVAAGGLVPPRRRRVLRRVRRRRYRRARVFFRRAPRVSADADAERDAERVRARDALRHEPSVFGLAEPARRRLAVRRAAKRTRPRRVFAVRRKGGRKERRHRRLPCARRRRPSRSRGGVRRRAGRIRRGRAGRSNQGAARRRGGGGGGGGERRRRVRRRRRRGFRLERRREGRRAFARRARADGGVARRVRSERRGRRSRNRLTAFVVHRALGVRVQARGARGRRGGPRVPRRRVAKSRTRERAFFFSGRRRGQRRGECGGEDAFGRVLNFVLVASRRFADEARPDAGRRRAIGGRAARCDAATARPRRPRRRL